MHGAPTPWLLRVPRPVQRTSVPLTLWVLAFNVFIVLTLSQNFINGQAHWRKDKFADYICRHGDREHGVGKLQARSLDYKWALLTPPAISAQAASKASPIVFRAWRPNDAFSMSWRALMLASPRAKPAHGWKAKA